MACAYCCVVCKAIASRNIDDLVRSLLLAADVAAEFVHAHSKRQRIDISIDVRWVASPRSRYRDAALNCLPRLIELSKKALSVAQIREAEHPWVLPMSEKVWFITLRTSQSHAGLKECLARSKSPKWNAAIPSARSASTFGRPGY